MQRQRQLLPPPLPAAASRLLLLLLLLLRTCAPSVPLPAACRHRMLASTDQLLLSPHEGVVDAQGRRWRDPPPSSRGGLAHLPARHLWVTSAHEQQQR
jgi:hypothetical protein